MGWRRFLRRSAWDTERSRELESYVQLEVDDNIARGMTADGARTAALRKLGNPNVIREEIYRFNTVTALDTLGRDLRYAGRVLRRHPGFALAALLTLAIGIGANTAIFSVIDRVLIEPLPYPDAGQLVSVANTAPGAPGLPTVSGDLRLSPSMYVTYSEENRAFQHLGLWVVSTATLTGLGQPEQVRTVLVSDGTLQALAVPPLFGRWLEQSDQRVGGPANVVLSWGYWQRRFGGDRSVLGRSIVLDSAPAIVVGVMPQRFQVVTADADLILPFRFDRGQLIRPGFGFQGVARLKPGVTIAQAAADVQRMFPIWLNAWPGGAASVYEAWRITAAIRPLKQAVVGRIGDVLWVLMGTLAIVMIMACANVANLLLVRVDGRQQELAVRVALGAGSWRIARELLVESVSLGMLGGVLGVALAFAGLKALVAIGPTTLPRLQEIGVDLKALAFAIVLSVTCGILFGLAPAFRYAGPRIAGALRAAGRTVTDSRERQRTRNILVVAQVALALVLLVSSGLIIRTFAAMRAVPAGFTDPAHVQTLRIAIPQGAVAEPERVARMHGDLLDRLAAIPGVTATGLASAVPMEGRVPNWDGIFAEGHVYAPDEFPPLRLFKFVSPRFFATLGTRIVAGRELTWTDVYGQRRAAILSEALARELFGSPAAAIGRHIGQRRAAIDWEVVGVVEDVRDNGVDAVAPATVYWPTLQPPFAPGQPSFALRNVTIVVRSRLAGGEPLLKQIQQAVWSVDSNLAVTSMRTMQAIYETSLARTSFALVMLATAGVMALLLGVIGIYGVISYTVTQRRREIGIRMALGASQHEVRRRFVRQGMRLAAIGVAVGIAVAFGVTRLMASLLFEVSPLDPLAYLGGIVLLVAAAAAASYVPARRASSVPPLDVLTAE
jgi:predicted permease